MRAIQYCFRRTSTVSHNRYLYSFKEISESDGHVVGDRVSEMRQTDDSEDLSEVGVGHVGETAEASEIDDD